MFSRILLQYIIVLIIDVMSDGDELFVVDSALTRSISLVIRFDKQEDAA